MLRIHSDILYLVHALQSAGFEAALVGGAVRDLLLFQKDNEHPFPNDFDITTNATPEQIQTVFKESYYENEFGTVGIAAKHVWEQFTLEPPKPGVIEAPPSTRIIDSTQATKLHPSLKEAVTSLIPPEEVSYPDYEITTYRSNEVYSTNFRKPDSLEWGSSLSEDLLRRDFTINALAIVIDQAWLETIVATKPAAFSNVEIPETAYTLIDEHNGIDHLHEGKLVAVGNADERFQEDALRMLRAVRFSVQLNFVIDDTTFEAILKHSPLIQHVSGERIRDELLKMLSSKFPSEAIELLDQTHLLDLVLPEIQEGKGVEQAGHHITDVWTHSLDALKECPSTDPIVRFATLLHDVAKPRTKAIINGQITFYNHEVVGAHLSKEICRRLRFSKAEENKIFTLIRYHMFYYQPENTDAAIRRFMRKVGLEFIDDLLDLREADRLGSNARRTSWRLEEMKQRMIEQLHQPMSVTDLAINGHDLMNELNVKPSPQIGSILQTLLEEVLEKPELNSKPILLEKAKLLITAQ